MLSITQIARLKLGEMDVSQPGFIQDSELEHLVTDSLLAFTQLDRHDHVHD
jgi:hypothetical protein